MSSDLEEFVKEMGVLTNCRSELHDFIDNISRLDHIPTEELSIALRFLRYAIELEILAQTRARVTLIGAYQILPFTASDAEIALDGLLDPERDNAEVASQIPTLPVTTLAAPLSDRNKSTGG